ncbi:MAG TPA: hypothetical protein VFW33_19710 [Gemmataceae bacterium]|nr:hypothetical protein [Gemmataceae bacterium]
MSPSGLVIGATLKPDGTLELDQKPALPPGRVNVIVQPVPAGVPKQRRLVDVIDEIQRRQQARGFQGRGAEEIEAGLREGEEEYERKMQAAHAQTTPAPPPSAP